MSTINVEEAVVDRLSASYVVLFDLLLRAVRNSYGVHLYAVEGLSEPAVVETQHAVLVFVPSGEQYTVDSVVAALRGSPVIAESNPHLSDDAAFDVWRAARVLAVKAENHLLTFYHNAIAASAAPVPVPDDHALTP